MCTLTGYVNNNTQLWSMVGVSLNIKLEKKTNEQMLKFSSY